MRKWLVLLLLLPAASACSLLDAPYSGLDISSKAFATTSTYGGLLVNLETGAATDLDLEFFPAAAFNPDGTRIATFHQEGLGADCSGTSYVRLLNADGTLRQEWEVDGPFYAWDGGFFAGEARNWNGQTISRPAWDHEWGDVLSADGTTWARYGWEEGNPTFPNEPSGDRQLIVFGATTTKYDLDMDYPRIAISDDGKTVGAVELMDGTVRVAIRSQDGPNWDWTFQNDGQYVEPSISINGNMAGVAAFHAYRLNLETGAAHRLDTDKQANSVGHHQQLGWILSDDGDNPIFVGSTTRAQTPLLTNQWGTANAPSWIPEAAGTGVDGNPTGQPPLSEETPFAFPLVGLVALLWLARKV
ncbi:MAG: hypothetical protein ACPHK8_05685 [Thermoplasmatota archaeon]